MLGLRASSVLRHHRRPYPGATARPRFTFSGLWAVLIRFELVIRALRKWARLTHLITKSHGDVLLAKAEPTCVPGTQRGSAAYSL